MSEVIHKHLLLICDMISLHFSISIRSPYLSDCQTSSPSPKANMFKYHLKSKDSREFGQIYRYKWVHLHNPQSLLRVCRLLLNACYFTGVIQVISLKQTWIYPSIRISCVWPS